jgi:hypothetical protein
MRFILLFDFAEQNQTQNKKAKLNAISKSNIVLEQNVIKAFCSYMNKATGLLLNKRKMHIKALFSYMIFVLNAYKRKALLYQMPFAFIGILFLYQTVLLLYAFLFCFFILHSKIKRIWFLYKTQNKKAKHK